MSGALEPHLPVSVGIFPEKTDVWDSDWGAGQTLNGGGITRWQTARCKEVTGRQVAHVSMQDPFLSERMCIWLLPLSIAFRLLFFSLCFLVLGIECRVSNMRGKHSTLTYSPDPSFYFILILRQFPWVTWTGWPSFFNLLNSWDYKPVPSNPNVLQPFHVNSSIVMLQRAPRPSVLDWDCRGLQSCEVITAVSWPIQLHCWTTWPLLCKPIQKTPLYNIYISSLGSVPGES